MSYYVSAINPAGKKRLLLGPFNRHGDALAQVERVRSYCRETFSDCSFGDVGFGTCHNRTGRPEAKLNGALGTV